MIQTRAYDNDQGDPVAVLVVTGTHDVSRLVNLFAGGVNVMEQLQAGEQLRQQIARHSGGRAAIKLLADHGGPDFAPDLETAIRIDKAEKALEQLQREHQAALDGLERLRKQNEGLRQLAQQAREAADSWQEATIALYTADQTPEFVITTEDTLTKTEAERMRKEIQIRPRAGGKSAVTRNADRLILIAATLRARRLSGDEHAAAMVEACQPIAIHWTEPYASPFVPLLHHALKLGDALGVPGLTQPTPSRGEGAES